ncbi:DUF3344 domain-containing protein [Streptomyces camelliae]|uniref:DUF3344 domain-containing protein n=1 Tax=Streptomyces camelliae TaxID=3004093 RepID=A0ABY7P9L1_9ACTN|nr:DUF3344 domain-containing protein [Streptomyces sp. HUAS 2-6]WBO66250.1 DUF3344 domain-containing protein [Streptomyces sp. HUAS 2-6]
MRKLLGPLLCTTAGALALASPALARPTAPPSPETPRLAFAERYHAVLHGGFVRAANAGIGCRGPKTPSCDAARQGRAGTNESFDMSYVDVDKDPNTYNSSRAEVRVPRGGRVTYARLYWGGNLLAGEQKPARDDGRVLVAEPGGAYKEVLADTVVGHQVAHGADAYQASADVTGLVRASGSGLYTVAQIDIAKGRSAAGAWGGWTLVVAYENPAQPLRDLSLWDGFDALDSPVEVRLNGVRVPTGGGGTVGIVAYDGDRGSVGDRLTLSPGPRRAPVALGDSVNPPDDVLNSTISEPGAAPARRIPAYANTLGYDSDVFDLGPALRGGGDQPGFRLVSQQDAAWAGVLFAAVDAQV